MVIADISILITRFMNNINTVTGLIWEVGWWCWRWWGWVWVVLWCFPPLRSLEEIQIQSELHVGNPWHGNSWAAESHLHSAVLRANAGQKWFVKNRRGNDGLGKGEGCTKSLRGSATADVGTVFVCVSVCAHAITKELGKAPPNLRSLCTSAFRHEPFPAGSGRDQALAGAGEVSAAQSSPLTLLMHHFCHRKENQSLMPVIKYLHYKGIPSSWLSILLYLGALC